MRRCMIVLAVTGILAGPLPAADDPFDFSSPLQNPTSENPKTRTAQYFSRTPSTEAEASADSTAGSVEAAGRQVSDRQQSVQFGHDAVRDTRRTTGTPQQAPSQERDPQDALRRFDEFLKSRETATRSRQADSQQTGSDDVVTAEFSDSQEQELSEIRQVQMEGDRESGQVDLPFPVDENLPSLGDLDEDPTATPTPKREETIQELLLGNQPDQTTQPTRRGDRLTDPISTTPASDFSPQPTAVDSTDAPFAEKTQTKARVESKPEPIEPSFNAKGFAGQSTPKAMAITPEASPNDLPNDLETPPAIQTTWTLLDPLNVGQECRAKLVVSNTGSATAERVSLEVRVPETVQVVQASPQPVEQVSFLGWKLPELAGGASQTIEVTFRATQPGSLDLGTYVRHTSARQNTYKATEPKLELTLSGPQQVHVGEPASQTLVLKNPGTGTATNVTIDAVIPTGLEHAADGKHLQMDIGSLNPGEVRSVRLVLAAVSGGEQTVQVQARADSGLVRTAAAEVKVVAPSLQAAISGPSLRYLGRQADYKIRVLNDGEAVTDFVQVNHRIPEGFEFVRADRGAKFDRSTRVLNWHVGRLESGDSLDLNVALKPESAGEFTHLVQASSERGAQAKAQMTTRVQGAASLEMIIADLDDPVEVGTQTAYEVTITNEGTAAARAVGLTCELPQGMEFVKAEGPTEHRRQNVMLGFQPVGQLAAGKSLTYRIFVRGANAGDQRFRCRLTSEALQEPLFSEELTKFYSE